MAVLREAYVQYGDMIGTAALDGHTGGELHNLARDKGVKGFPIAWAIRPGWDHTTDERFLLITIYATDVASSADGVAEYAAEHNNSIPAKTTDVRVTLREFDKYVKRFEVVLRQRGFTEQDIEYDTDNGIGADE